MNTVLYYLLCLGLVEMLSEWEAVLGALSSSTSTGPWVEGCRQAPLSRVHATSLGPQGLVAGLGGDSNVWSTQRKKILNMKILLHSSGLAQPDLALLLGCHASLGH